MLTQTLQIHGGGFSGTLRRHDVQGVIVLELRCALCGRRRLFATTQDREQFLREPSIRHDCQARQAA